MYDEEEESLVHRLEEEHDKAIESAILEEETWLEELAREQSREIHVDTEPDTEQEDILPVRILAHHRIHLTHSSSVLKFAEVKRQLLCKLAGILS